MSKHITTEPIEIAAFTAECTDPPYCVATARSGNTIMITSTVPAHLGAIELTVDEFVRATEAIKAADPLELNPFDDGQALRLFATGDEDSTYTMAGPDGSAVKFYSHELSAFYNGVRAGEFDETLRLDTLVAAPA